MLRGSEGSPRVPTNSKSETRVEACVLLDSPLNQRNRGTAALTRGRTVCRTTINRSVSPRAFPRRRIPRRPVVLVLFPLVDKHRLQIWHGRPGYRAEVLCSSSHGADRFIAAQPWTLADRRGRRGNESEIIDSVSVPFGRKLTEQTRDSACVVAALRCALLVGTRVQLSRSLFRPASLGGGLSRSTHKSPGTIEAALLAGSIPLETGDTLGWYGGGLVRRINRPAERGKRGFLH